MFEVLIQTILNIKDLKEKQRDLNEQILKNCDDGFYVTKDDWIVEVNHKNRTIKLVDKGKRMYVQA